MSDAQRHQDDGDAHADWPTDTEREWDELDAANREALVEHDAETKRILNERFWERMAIANEMPPRPPSPRRPGPANEPRLAQYRGLHSS